MSESTTTADLEPNPPPPVRAARPWRQVALFVAGLLILLGAYLAFAPSPIDPVAYTPDPSRPLEGPLAPNTKLRSAEALAVGKIVGPEDIETDAEGRIVTGLADGRIVRISEDGSIDEIANTGGRPIGMEYDRDGNLIVVDGARGLLRVAPDGQIKVLASEVGGKPFGLADDVDVASDGVIYFSDASDKFGEKDILFDLLEGRPHGRLIKHNPETGETQTLLEGLYFANGVALSKDEDFVLVCETYAYRIKRYWLKGEKAGQSEIFIDKLPGFPDNITSNRDGKFWLALFTVRNDTMNWLSPRPAVKSILAKLPRAVWPAPDPYAFVIALDENGNILESLQDPGGEKFHEVTSAHERDGQLYLGSLSNDRIGKYSLGAPSEPAP